MVAGWGGLVAGAAGLGWAVAATLGGLSPVAPMPAAVLAAAVALAAGRGLAGRLGGAAAFLPCWLGVLAPALPGLRDRLSARLGDASFERVGLLWIGGGWRHAFKDRP